VTTEARDAIGGTDVTFIAVGTPLRDHGIDLRAILSATETIGDVLADKDGFHVVVVKSTVVPGTTVDDIQPLLERASGKRTGHEIGVAVNPEFLTEGQAVDDFMRPDRIVIGAADERTRSIVVDLYRTLATEAPRVLTTPSTAEMIKYASNALLATAISFSNEIANLCSALRDVDVVDVQRGVHLSRYLTTGGDPGRDVAPIASFLEAGCGFGGSCLPKDVRALIDHGERAGRSMRLLSAVIETNERQPDEVLRILERELGDLEGARVTVLGLAFKPDTDDVRESPAIPIVRGILQKGGKVTVHDPVVSALPDALDADGAALTRDLAGAIHDADGVVVVTRWRDYEVLPDLIAALEQSPVVVDGRRMFRKSSFERYAGIGAA
jgi:UDPglucose 6-dehydrogenase